MGNHLTCMSPATLKRLQATSDSNQNLIRFLHCETGAVSELEGPLTAAEVMMEFPAQFLSCFPNALPSGRRITAVPADEELRAAVSYLLLPMHKLNARFFSGEEMAFFATLEAGKVSGKKQSRGGISQSKVAPFPALMCTTQSSNAEGVVMQSTSCFKQVDAAVSMGTSRNVMCRSKSWIPKLETITESVVAS